MDKLADLLRQGADKLVNLPTEAQRFVTNPQAFIQLLTGKNALPRETGFAAGATGLPAQQSTVLDPNYQAYMQGYEQGEPFGYAAMATPAVVPVAKALAPKAGQMAENYMVNQGFMPSIVAYHGTPHTIKGKFDISKVGTGEGAQAYGHGMYFAENPKVAETYANIAPSMGSYPSMRRSINGVEVEIGSPEAHAATLLSRQGMTVKKAKDLVNSWISDPSAMSAGENTIAGWKKTLDTLNTIKKKSDVKDIGLGNLYKVDIPDEYIPNMFDWDKTISEQPKEVRDAMYKAIKNLPEIEGFNLKNWMDADPLASTWHNSIIRDLGVAPNELSTILNKEGIKGIRYLDEVSRAKGKGTSNFVVFEPSEVKILEQNSKPMTRKEILEQELKKVVE